MVCLNPICFCAESDLFSPFFVPSLSLCSLCSYVLSGSAQISEACEAAKSIAGANPNSALLVLFPVPHTSLEKKTCVEYRRQIEDRLMTCHGFKFEIDCVTVELADRDCSSSS